VCEPAFAVIQARRMLEAMLHDVVLEHRKKTSRNGRGEGLDAWRQELVTAGVMPRMTASEASLIQQLGNIAAHPNAEEPGHLEALPALLALMNVMRWFLKWRDVPTKRLN